MAALAKARLTPIREGAARVLPVAAATRVLQGALVGLLAGGIVPASANTAIKVLGVAGETADNSSGAAGALTVSVHREVARFDNDAADAIAVSDIGSPCYATDDHTVAKTSASATKPAAGTIFDVDDQGVWVAFI